MEIFRWFNGGTGLILALVYSLFLVWFHVTGIMNHSYLLLCMIALNGLGGYWLGKVIGRLRRYGLTDPVSQACNRRCFVNELGKTLKRKRTERFSVIMLDINDFKICNDTAGHDVGDRVLFIVAQTIKGNLRRGDHVGRVGGDEFAVLLSERAKREAIFMMTQLNSLVNRALRKYGVSVSMGIATYPDDATDIDNLWKIADMNMYRVKGNRLSATKG